MNKRAVALTAAPAVRAAPRRAARARRRQCRVYGGLRTHSPGAVSTSVAAGGACRVARGRDGGLQDPGRPARERPRRAPRPVRLQRLGHRVAVAGVGRSGREGEAVGVRNGRTGDSRQGNAQDGGALRVRGGGAGGSQELADGAGGGAGRAGLAAGVARELSEKTDLQTFTYHNQRRQPDLSGLRCLSGACSRLRVLLRSEGAAGDALAAMRSGAGVRAAGQRVTVVLAAGARVGRGAV